MVYILTIKRMVRDLKNRWRHFWTSLYYLRGTVCRLRGAVGSVRTTEPVGLRAAPAGTHRAVTLTRPGAKCPLELESKVKRRFEKFVQALISAHLHIIYSMITFHWSRRLWWGWWGCCRWQWTWGRKLSVSARSSYLASAADAALLPQLLRLDI